MLQDKVRAMCVKMLKHTPSVEVAKKTEVEEIVLEKVAIGSKQENIEHTEAATVASGNSKENFDTKVDIKDREGTSVYIGTNSINNGKTMSNEELWNLGRII